MESDSMNIDTLDQWFKEDIKKGLNMFFVKLTGILDEVDSEVDAAALNFDPSIAERIAREIKANGLDKIENLILDIINFT